MATIPLNKFVTKTSALTTTLSDIYTAPAGVSSIILMAQIANITSTATPITLTHNRGAANTDLIKDYVVPGNDAASALTGKLVLESGDKIKASAGTNSRLNLILSILESANE